MNYFSISLRDASGSRELGAVQFISMNAACADVRAAIPDAAAELLREGKNPLDYLFRVIDLDDDAVCDVPFSIVLSR